MLCVCLLCPYLCLSVCLSLCLGVWRSRGASIISKRFSQSRVICHIKVIVDSYKNYSCQLIRTDTSSSSNFTVFVFKLAAYFYTSSATMLSEAVHSLVDMLNQVRGGGTCVIHVILM